jgi:hypothetical protein
MLTDDELDEIGAWLKEPYPIHCEAAPSYAKDLLAEVRRLQAAVRHHRDQRGDDRCWMDDEELYRALPEGFTPPPRDSRVELANCERYIASRHNPGTEYVSPEREIERLRAELKDAHTELTKAAVALKIVGDPGVVDDLKRRLESDDLTE